MTLVTHHCCKRHPKRLDVQAVGSYMQPTPYVIYHQLFQSSPQLRFFSSLICEAESSYTPKEPPSLRASTVAGSTAITDISGFEYICFFILQYLISQPVSLHSQYISCPVRYGRHDVRRGHRPPHRSCPERSPPQCPSCRHRHIVLSMNAR